MNPTAVSLAKILTECRTEVRDAVDRAGCLHRPYLEWYHARLEVPRTRVQEWIVSQPGYQPGLMIPNGGGCETFDGSAAQALLALSLKFGIDETAIWYSSLISRKPTTGLSIWLLQGIKTVLPISITEQVSLIPFAAIPQSRMTEEAAKFVLAEHRLSFGGAPTLATLSALVVSYEFDQRLGLYDSPVPAPTGESLTQIMEGLSLVGPSSVRPVRHWGQTADPMFEFVRGGAGYGDIHHDLAWTVGAPEAYLTAGSVELVQKYVPLAKKHPHLSISVQRLSAALRRNVPTDKAIELGTALESAIAGDSSAEITYRLSLRVARLLGVEVTERRKIRSTMKAFYNMRSAAVHTGKTSREYKVTGQPPMTSSSLAGAAQDYLVSCLRLFVNQGFIPDWDEVELS